MKINNNKIKSLFLLSLAGSVLAKEEKANNQTEITYSDGVRLNSLPQLATNLTKREDNSDPTLVFGGYPINFVTSVTQDRYNCSFGFAVTYSEANDPSSCLLLDANPGLITSAFCCAYGDCASDENKVFTVSDNPVALGDVVVTSLCCLETHPDAVISAPDFALAGVDETTNVKLIPYVIGYNNSLYPITSFGSVPLGT